MTILASDGPETRTTTALLYTRVFFLILCLMAPLAAVLDRAAGYSACVTGVLMFALWPLAWREKPPIAWAALGWMAALSVLALISSIWALDHSLSLGRALKITPEVLAGALFIGVLPRFAAKIPRGWLWLLPTAYALGLAVLAADLYAGLPLYRIVHRVPQSFHLHADAENKGALFCVLLYMPMMAFIFALPGIDRRRLRMLAAGLTLLLLAVLFATASQSAQLAFLLIAAIALAFPWGWRPVWYALMVLLAGLMLGAPWLAEAMFGHMAPWVAALPGEEIRQAYMPNRMEIWDTVSRYALQSPWHGFGIDATRAVPAFDTKQIYQNDAKLPHPHNFAIQLWMEFGFIGGLFGAGLIAHMLWFLMNGPTKAQQRIALPTLIGCLSVAAMTFSLWQGWWLGLLFLAAGMARLAMTFYPAEAKIDVVV